MEISYGGGCACGAVRLVCSSEPLAMYNCHCSGCQSASGALFASLLVLPQQHVSITGSPRRYNRPALADRHGRHAFCGECGSPLFAASDTMADLLLVHAVVVHDYPSFRPVADIWTVDAWPGVPMDRHIPKVYKAPPLLGDHAF